MRAGPADADLLWVTGRGTYEEFARYHRPPAVQVIDFLDPMADGYAVADLVVSRAGMITVAELCAWGLPSILVPLPTAAADHQTHNARVLAEAGAARCCRRPSSRPTRLARRVGEPARRSAGVESDDGGARAGPRPTPRRARHSVEFIDAGRLSADFQNSQQLLTLAHPPWTCSPPRIGVLSISSESAAPA